VQSKSANLALLALVLCVAIALHSATASAFTLTNPNSWPLIPIPEIVTDPYAGTRMGLMPVFLQLNSSQQIGRIIAPDVNYNTILGPGGTLRYFAYPSADTQWYAIGGASLKNASSFEFDYATGMERSRWLSFDGHFLYQRDPDAALLRTGQ
jgi:hypothetical protein